MLAHACDTCLKPGRRIESERNQIRRKLYVDFIKFEKIAYAGLWHLVFMLRFSFIFFLLLGSAMTVVGRRKQANRAQ